MSVYSVDPSFEDIESALLKLVDLCSYDGSEVAFADANGKKIKSLMFPIIEADNSLIDVAKQFIRKVLI